MSTIRSRRQNFDLAAWLSTIEPLEKAVLAVLGVAAGWYTYVGASLLEPRGDWMSKVGFALLAGAVGCGLYLGWRSLSVFWPRLSFRGRVMATPVVFMFAFSAVGVSGFFNLSGLIGERAVERNLQVTAERFSEEFGRASNAAQQGLLAIPSLKITATKLADLAAAERNGATTGDRGRGAVAIMLDQAAKAMNSGVELAEKKAPRIDALSREIEALLVTMRAAASGSSATLATRVESFASAAESLRLKLLELSRIETGSIARAAAAAARNVAPPALSSNPTIAARQREAIEKVSAMLNDIGSLSEATAQAGPTPLLAQPVRSITVYSAVQEHILDFIPAALAAVLIDLLPLPLLLLRLVVFSEIRTAPMPSAAHRYTISDLVEMMGLLAMLRDRGPIGAPIDLLLPIGEVAGEPMTVVRDKTGNT